MRPQKDLVGDPETERGLLFPHADSDVIPLPLPLAAGLDLAENGIALGARYRVEFHGDESSNGGTSTGEEAPPFLLGRRINGAPRLRPPRCARGAVPSDLVVSGTVGKSGRPPASPSRLDGHRSQLLRWFGRSEEHTSELQSLRHLVCRL